MIKKYFLAFVFIYITISGCNTKSNKQKQQVTPIEKLAHRIAPEHYNSFEFEIIDNKKEDVFEIESKREKIYIKGNNYNSMAVGLNYYLKKYCHTYVSWYADDTIDFPKVLPTIIEKITKSARVENRFFLNYCTFGYTMPWWQWRDWERMIDWMALNGVTMPLAITGQEDLLG